jgi:hypothetical protein
VAAPGTGDPKFNVSFVVEIFVGGSIGKFEVYPEFNDSNYYYGKIDVSNYVAPYINTQFVKPINTTVTIYDPSGWKYVNIVVYEKYSLNFGDIPTTHTTANSYEIGVFKGKLSRTEFLSWDYTDYQKGLTKELMTDRPFRLLSLSINLYEQTIKKEDSLTYTWIDNTSIDTPTNYKVRYTYYNGTTIIKQTDESFTTSNQGLLGSIYFNLDQHVSLGYLTSGEATSCTSVLIGLLNTSNVTLSNVTWLFFDETCFFNGATLRFMNKFGAYDNYLFTYNKRYSASVKAFEFERSQGSWNSGVYSLSKTNTGRLSYLKQTTKKLELSSDWLDETTQNWLTQLYDSPAVYINEGQENESVMITNSSYQIKQDKHDELFNEIVEIEFTTENSIRI